MKKLARFLGYLSAGWSALTLFPPRRGGVVGVLWPPKAFAEAWISLRAVFGYLAVLAGFKHRDHKAAAAGLAGAVIATRHLLRVSAPRDAFAQTFGTDWWSRIPPVLRARLSQRRYVPFATDPSGARWQRDVVIGAHIETGDPLLADLWLPPVDVPPTGLAVIYLHGSGWFALDKDYYTRHFFRHLAVQGHVVMDVAYTLTPKARLTAMVADVHRAIAWMKVNAAGYGVNPDHVVLVGGSAGGHLAMLAAYTPNHPALKPRDVMVDTLVRAVVSYYGLPDLRAFHDYLNQRQSDLLNTMSWRQSSNGSLHTFLRQARLLPSYGEMILATDMIVRLLGGTPDEKPELCALGSPINHVGPHCPPTLLVQGLHDGGGMMPEVRRLHYALQEAGAVSVLIELPNTGHGFDVVFPRLSPAAQAATYDVERFLALMVREG